jgi:hypothetical protein
LRWRKLLDRLRKWEDNTKVDIMEADERWIEWAVSTNWYSFPPYKYYDGISKPGVITFFLYFF